MGLSFKLWRAADEPVDVVEKELREAETALADKREELAAIETELADLGVLSETAHRALRKGKAAVSAEVERLCARVALLKSDLETARVRDRQAAARAKVAASKDLHKRRVTAIKREADAIAAALAASAEIEAIEAEHEALGKEAVAVGVDGPAALPPREMTLRMTLARAGHLEREFIYAESRRAIFGPTGAHTVATIAAFGR